MHDMHERWMSHKVTCTPARKIAYDYTYKFLPTPRNSSPQFVCGWQWRTWVDQLSCDFRRLLLRESFCESGEGVRLPTERGWPPGKSGNFRGSPGNFRWSLGNFRGTPGLLLSSTVRELPGKSPKNFRGSLGNFRGSVGPFQKLGRAWLPPSDSPNLSPNWDFLSQVKNCSDLLAQKASSPQESLPI